MQVRNWKWCCHIKLWIAIKESSVSRAFNIIFILVYCGLYTMTIEVVTWRIIKKLCICSLHLQNFLWLSVFALFLQKIHGSSCNFLNFIYIYIYIYIKLKLGTAKHICVKWVFLPQSFFSSLDMHYMADYTLEKWKADLNLSYQAHLPPQANWQLPRARNRNIKRLWITLDCDWSLESRHSCLFHLQRN